MPTCSWKKMFQVIHFQENAKQKHNEVNTPSLERLKWKGLVLLSIDENVNKLEVSYIRELFGNFLKFKHAWFRNSIYKNQEGGKRLQKTFTQMSVTAFINNKNKT